MAMEIIDQFRAGDAIPEWMISVSPRQPEAVPGSLTFMVDCTILSNGETFVVVPSQSKDIGKHLIMIAHSRHCNFSAVDNKVVLCCGFVSLNVDGSGEDQHYP